MKKAIHIEIGEKIDWYGHGEILECGVVLETKQTSSKEITFLIDDKNTSSIPFKVRKKLDQLISIF